MTPLSPFEVAIWRAAVNTWGSGHDVVTSTLVCRRIKWHNDQAVKRALRSCADHGLLESVGRGQGRGWIPVPDRVVSSKGAIYRVRDPFEEQS